VVGPYTDETGAAGAPAVLDEVRSTAAAATHDDDDASSAARRLPMNAAAAAPPKCLATLHQDMALTQMYAKDELFSLPNWKVLTCLSFHHHHQHHYQRHTHLAVGWGPWCPGATMLTADGTPTEVSGEVVEFISDMAPHFGVW